MVSTEDIKRLRDETGLSIGMCKAALEEGGGDHDKALVILQQKAGAVFEKKSTRTLGAGTVASYVHTTRTIGVMLELDCETDFVARNEEFQALARDLAMHVSACATADVPALLEEPFVKDPEKTVKQLIESAVQKFGEKMEVARFVRYSVLD